MHGFVGPRSAWTFLLAAVTALPGMAAETAVPFSDVARAASEGRLASVTIKGSKVVADLKDGGILLTDYPPYFTSWFAELLRSGVRVSYVPPVQESGVLGALRTTADTAVPFLMFAMFALAIVFLLRSSLLRGVHRTFTTDTGKSTTFSEVAGATEAKDSLAEVVDFLRHTDRYKAVGARIPRGVLLAGPPGNGKTLIARAVAGEAGVPFLFVSGSDFVEVFGGLGARRVRTTFAALRRRRPAILFIDEIDALGRTRGQGAGGGGAEREHDHTLNQLLVEMDGMAGSDGVVVIAATNRVDVLDPALLRAGRFDRQVHVGVPTLSDRRGILGAHVTDLPLAPDVDLDVLARATTGFSGADLATLANEAAIDAARRRSPVVAQANFEHARDLRLLGGAARAGVLVDPDERRLVAVHEAGHALTAVLQPECDPVHKASIGARGPALGMVSRLPMRDALLVRRSKVVADLVVLMGGRAAETVTFGDDGVSTGAAADLQVATQVARDMVERYGMGGTLAQVTPGVSAGTRTSADRRVEEILSEALAKATGLLSANKGTLDALAAALLEHEVLDGSEVAAIVARGTPALSVGTERVTLPT